MQKINSIIVTHKLSKIRKKEKERNKSYVVFKLLNKIIINIFIIKTK